MKRRESGNKGGDGMRDKQKDKSSDEGQMMRPFC